MSRLWVVASNGAVVFRYPPLEVVHEETFDARPAVEAILREHPGVLVAVEERGVGYRVNRPFPAGELSGDMVITDVADLVARARQPGDHPRPRLDRRGLRRPGRPARPARHRLRRRLDGLARPRARRGQQGVRARARRRAARGRRGRRARHRRRPQRHRDAAVGRPRRRHGPGRRGGASRPPTTSPARCTTTAPPPRSPAGSPMPETWTFTAPLWRWNAKQESTDPGSWSFVTLPTDVAEDIRDVMVEPPRGFGSVKVAGRGGRGAVEHERVPRQGVGQLRAPGQAGRQACRRHRGGRPGHGHACRW